MQAPQGGAHRVGDTPDPSRVRSSPNRCLQAAVVLAELCDAFGPPSVSKVAARLGLSKNGTHKRLLTAVDRGWLHYRERADSASFAPTERLWSYMDEHAVSASITVMEGE